MGFAATMIFYHLIGLGVATAVLLSDSRQGGLPVFRFATAVVFWPLYLPMVLAGERPGTRPEMAPPPHDSDAMSRAISQVEAELETALASLDGWVEHVLAHEAGRFRELSTAWARPTGFVKWIACSPARSRSGPSRWLMSPGRARAIVVSTVSRLASQMSAGFARFETGRVRT